ncbi:hypothetical protein HS5_21680 [Acidianus sp. HS-5]|nr:hypothetical protein HS5_21680 [Acidianus sp. HS-5]
MIQISQTVWNTEKKNSIRFDGDCIIQIIRDIPPRSVINQACYIFFRTYTKSRIKDPKIYFLTLLYSTSQITDALARVKFNEGDIGYIIKCCKKDVNQFERIQIKDNNERIALSANAINSLI